jgi:protein transport protein SEC61 subunit gamma and related proteins
LDIQELVKRCIRILYISRKPTGSEFSKVAKITALGMFIFGFLGFLISVIFRFIR